ncbi:response regulator [Desulfosarcina ovata subsp. sediminis]|uniref:Response regulator n=1 Tax=Desulfosarcina ovata subsp. sediminis TaxID=885957 RepID=A0A5K8A157_9BACT|nr:response regulator [Desulfosarcina ovata]BBO86315.1 response regulator [Desulfosarcina ovata subsp. sediminis]
METENKIRILLVDDEVKFLTAIADRLSLKGFVVTTADNGDDAIKAAEKGGFDVAVVDLQMPGTDGAAVLKILKQNHKFIEIIMLTGHATVDSAVECTRLGAFKYLEKPYDFERLVDALKEAYEARMKKKFEHNQQRMEAIQKLSMHQSPLGLLKELARLDDGVK